MIFDLNKESFSKVKEGKKRRSAQMIAEACNEISRANVEAMIVIEHIEKIKSDENNGIRLEAELSKELLVNIFNYEKPARKAMPREESSTIALSDGAVIIRNNKIFKAACSIVMSDMDKKSIRSQAIDISSKYSALVIVCEKNKSKEIVKDNNGNEIPQRGIISVVDYGKIKSNLEIEELKDILSGRNTVKMSDVSKIALKIKGFFVQNVFSKIFSFLAAFILWVIVININNPMETYSFSTNVTFSGEESLTAKNLVWMNKSSLQDSKVNIKVRGKRLALEQLKTESANIKALVNLQSEVYNSTVGETNKILVNITLPNISGESFEITERTPQYLDIILEKYETIQKDITLNVTGSLKDGFVMGNTEIVPNVVQVSGPASLIATVSEVKVIANVSGISKDLNIAAAPKAYDIYGNEVLGVDLSVEKVTVNIPVNESKRIKVDASANQGMLESGYVLMGITWEPAYIEIIGKSDKVALLEKLEIEPVDLTGINQDTEIMYRIADYLPEGVKLKDGSPEEIKVNILIAKEEVKDFRIPIRNITVQGFNSSSQQYKLMQEYIWVTVKAVESIMERIDTDNIRGNINIGSYSIGEHYVPVEFSLPSGASIVGGTPTVYISISNEEETSTEQETEEETEENVPVISTETKTEESTEQESTEEETEEETQQESTHR